MAKNDGDGAKPGTGHTPRKGMGGSAPVRHKHEGAPLFGCQFCGKPLWERPYVPENGIDLTFCSEAEYASWRNS